MKNRKRIIASGLLLLLFAAGFLSLPFMQRDDAAGATPKRERGEAMKLPVENPPDGNTVQIPGVGAFRYKSVERGFSSGEWMRRINHLLKPDDFQTEEDFAWRDENNRWNKLDVFYGDQGEILHIQVHKGLFKTYPMDRMAIASLQNDQGLSIVRIGYTDEMLKSGYSADDFAKDTLEHWDCRYVDEREYREVEITPVIVKIVSAGHAMNSVKDKYFIGREIPMILVKEGTYIDRSEAPIITETAMDGFSYNESIRRTWALNPYVPVEWNGDTILPPVGGGVPFNEPLMEAWNKRQAEAGKRDRK